MNGSLLIGAAASLFVLLNGRIAGISGLLASLLETGGEGRSEKLLFLLGILLVLLICQLCVLPWLLACIFILMLIYSYSDPY